MKILETVLGLSDIPQVFKCDSILHKGRLWLVPQWRISPNRKTSSPVRIIRIDHLPHQSIDRARGIDADFILTAPLPRTVFEGTAPSELAQKYYVEEAPDIRRARRGIISSALHSLGLR
ncbi:MAG: hypothetical protein KJ587_06555 [Alphaproteobacteria bacterium]|nr:hypothetical protein [Alphaproteobacteria bacterium]